MGNVKGTGGTREVKGQTPQEQTGEKSPLEFRPQDLTREPLSGVFLFPFGMLTALAGRYAGDVPWKPSPLKTPPQAHPPGALPLCPALQQQRCLCTSASMLGVPALLHRLTAATPHHCRMEDVFTYSYENSVQASTPLRVSGESLRPRGCSVTFQPLPTISPHSLQ